MTEALVVAILAVVVLAVLWWRAETRLRRQQRTMEDLRQAARAHAERLRHLELENTTHRLNPHLFKNTLNTVQSFAYRTNWALERLGSLFDFMLYDSQTGAVSLEEEITFLKDLIELNKLRLGPVFDLSVRLDVDPNDRLFRERLVAPLITAPFLENAFKHGDLDSDQGFVHIEVHLLDGHLHYEVANRTRGEADTATRRGGLGMTVLQQRLHAMYPDRHTLRYEADGTAFRALMTIDLEAAHAALRTA